MGLIDFVFVEGLIVCISLTFQAHHVAPDKYVQVRGFESHLQEACNRSCLYIQLKLRSL